MRSLPFPAQRKLVIQVLRNHFTRAVLLPVSVLVVLIKTLIWLRVSQSPELFLTNDSGNYVKMAQNFWSSYFSGDRSEISLLIAPGFPFLLSGFFEIGLIHQVPLALSLLPIPIGLLVYRLFRSKSKQLAALSYLYIICEPVLFFESFYVLSDTLFLLLLTGMATVVSHKQFKESLLLQSVLGLLLGFAVLTRPVFLYFPLLCFIFLLVWRRQYVKSSLLPITLGLGIATSWILYNYSEFRVPVVSSVQYKNLILGEVAGIRELADKIPYREVLVEENLLLTEALGVSPSPMQVSEFNTKRFLNVSRQHPLYFFLNHIRGSMMILFGVGSGAIRGITDQYFPVLGTFSVILSVMITSVVGVRFLFRYVAMVIKSPSLTLFASCSMIFVTYFLIVSSGATAYSRFRIPLMFAICIVVFSPKEILFRNKDEHATQT